MNPILKIMRSSEKYAEYIKKLKEGKATLKLGGLTNFAKKQIVASTFFELENKDSRKYVFVTKGKKELEKAYSELKYYASNVYKFPEKDINSFEVISETKTELAKRMETLKKVLLYNEPVIIVTTVGAMMQQMVSPELLKDKSLYFKVGETLSTTEISKKLTEWGYTKLDTVEVSGSYSVRGGIIDIAMSDKEGVRVELWDDEITSIRIFEISNQKSIRKEESIGIYPATEYVLSRDPEDIVKEIREKNSSSNSSDLFNYEMEEILDGKFFKHVEKYWSAFYKESSTFVDYLDKKDVFFIDKPSDLNLLSKEIIEEKEKENSFNEKQKGRPRIDAYDKLRTFEEFEDDVIKQMINLVHLDERSTVKELIGRGKIFETIDFSYKESHFFRSEMDLLYAEIQEAKGKERRLILLAGENVGEINEFLKVSLKEKGIDINIPVISEEKLESLDVMSLDFGAYLMPGKISEGFVLEELNLQVIDISTIKRKKDNRNTNLEKTEKIIFADLRPGDYIVHRYNGIGKFVGIEKVSFIGGVTKEYIKLEYKGGDYIYVPTDNISNIRKYIASDMNDPKLNKLGTKEWERTTLKVKRSLRTVAKELVKLYAERLKAKGYKFSPDDEYQKTFEDAFQYVETNDQLRCTEEIKSDMESIRPMDRLLCGDVGFGKTEVAIRAAFKAVNDSKQVAYIVPTTVLSMQQYESFKKRMAEFPIEVEQISRMKTPKQQKNILERLKNGKIDIIIGTHRLLSSDIEFNDLGLLIVDEEHRFGVKAKEKIKAMKKDVDVLSMSATPIPRTMHMSISGIRDMSVIYDPPEERLPVKTYLVEKDPEVIKQAITKELSRNGQVLFMHNKIRDIEFVVENIRKLVPGAKVDYAHGQMTSRQIEDRMQRFVDGETDVFVSTTIIESGIDIPNANTIIIDDGDKLGLAQLYQLRGRVGRSSRQAHAYIMFDDRKIMSETSEERLKAIREFTELGSGFKIAMRDLQIRGAGSMFGEVQHGHLEQVGYETYVRLLEEVVSELQGKEKEEDDEATVELTVDAFIPDKYISEQRYKMDIYKRIVQVKNNEEMEAVKAEIKDMYGELPYQLENFIKVIIVKNIASKKGVLKILELKSADNESSLNFHFGESFDMDNVDKIIKIFGSKVMFKESNEEGIKGIMVLRFKESKDILGFVKKFLEVMEDSRKYKKKLAKEDELKTKKLDNNKETNKEVETK